MTNQEIENYINTYRMYPDEYKGKRDTNILFIMNGSYKYNPKDQTVTRTEGRINDNGDFELVGLFTFPVDNPEAKTPVSVDERTIKYGVKSYNKLLLDLGYKNKIIEPGTDRENWNIRDMVSEIEYIRSTYYDKNHDNGKLRDEDFRKFDSVTRKLRHFIRTYKPYMEGVKAHTTHNSKYDS